MTPVPFYKDQVWWSARFIQLMGVAMAVAAYALTVPGIPKWLQYTAAVVIVIGTELGIHAYSASVFKTQVLGGAAPLVTLAPLPTYSTTLATNVAPHVFEPPPPAPGTAPAAAPSAANPVGAPPAPA